MFASRLSATIIAKKSPLVVGLDPDISKFPSSLRLPAKANIGQITDSILAFNKTIIDHTADLAAAIKPQSAFYEKYGWAGIKALEDTCHYAQTKGLLVIMDAKRGDVPNTAAAYAEAYLAPDVNPHALSCDALTVNPFLGRDSLEPLIDASSRNGRGIFVLVRTSNPGAADLQNLTIQETEQPLWAQIASWVSTWAEQLKGDSGYSSIGVVAGLTHPKEAHALRKLLPHSYLLLPGLGAQGGKATDALQCFDKNGLGALLIAARSIIFAYDREPYKNTFSPNEFGPAARQAALDVLTGLKTAGYPLQ